MTPQFIQDGKKLSFDEENHIYSMGDKVFVGCTTFIKEFSHPFDPKGETLARCAAERGLSQVVLKKQWTDKADKASKIGRAIHSDIENFLSTGKIKKNKYTPILEKFSQLKFKGELFPECRLYDEDLLIAGTSDIIQIIDNKICQCHDIKTNEKIPSDFSYKRKMKYPLEHLNDSKLNHYFLQISLYLYILSSRYGYEIGDKHFIFWIDRAKNDIVKIPVQLKMNEIIDMISYYSYLKF